MRGFFKLASLMAMASLAAPPTPNPARLQVAMDFLPRGDGPTGVTRSKRTVAQDKRAARKRKAQRRARRLGHA